jgi:primosomal protein N' (replication factor Y) (superfamily II helicase)
MPAPHASSVGGDSPRAASGARVRVLLPLPLAGAYDYAVPAGIDVAPGDFVAVPLGARQVAGVVWGPSTDEVAAEKVKPIAERLAAPPLSAELRQLVDWVAAYTLAPPGAVLRMAMSVPDALDAARPLVGYGLSVAGRAALDGDTAELSALSAPRRRVLAEAALAPGIAVDLARRAACGAGVVKGLTRTGLLEPMELPRRAPLQPPDWRLPGPTLSAAQELAATDLIARLGTGFSVTFLDGVTGSGKTEVYFAAIAGALERGTQVLVLLPEIALSAQWFQRFARRFGAAPAQWHSDLGQTIRRDTWRAVASGEARLVVGARSALFLPFHELGLIVVDEEQDQSFKQEEGVIYQARDMAVVRASLAKIPIALVSATPSVETQVNVDEGRYGRVHLPARHGTARLPEIRLVDMRRTPPDRRSFLAPPLLTAIRDTLAAGEQAMLFLNRRGYAPLTLCRQCGFRLNCPNCTAWLVEHRFHHRLQCHHCGHGEPLPALCPNCGAAASFAACGPGVERVAEEVTQKFPAARVAVMASDTLTGPQAAAALLDRVEQHDIDVLIGTQVVAKGHHFPLLTLVGVVDADLGLDGGDLRAAERSFQLLHQVAGRAGRAEQPGLVLVQTYNPDNPVMRALVADDRDRFLALEAEAREKFGNPPFGRMAALIISAPDEESAEFTARAYARSSPHLPGVEVFGPAPAPLALLRGRHRQRFLVKARRTVRIQQVMRDWLARVKLPSNVRAYVDIDPYNFL